MMTSCPTMQHGGMFDQQKFYFDAVCTVPAWAALTVEEMRLTGAS